MNRDQYIAIIKARLGGQLLDIELTGEQIGELVDIAFMELNPYIDTPYFKTLPANSCIDLSNENVRAILYVVRANASSINSTVDISAMLFSPLTYTTNQYSTLNGYTGTTSLLKGYTTSLIYQQIRNTTQQDLDYTWDGREQKLYLYQQLPTSQMITVVYNKNLVNVEEIQDDYWVNYLIRLSLAYTKETLGRIRSKYKMTSAPYELDGDTLLSEAQSELTELRQFLQDNDNLFMPID